MSAEEEINEQYEFFFVYFYMRRSDGERSDLKRYAITTLQTNRTKKNDDIFDKRQHVFIRNRQM
jgi:hypothetical protein